MQLYSYLVLLIICGFSIFENEEGKIMIFFLVPGTTQLSAKSIAYHVFKAQSPQTPFLLFNVTEINEDNHVRCKLYAYVGS